MAGTVKDITDALKGSISRELMSREGRRIKGTKSDGLVDGARDDVTMDPNDVKPHVGPKPEDNIALVAKKTLDHEDLNAAEKRQVESGGHIEGLDEE